MTKTWYVWGFDPDDAVENLYNCQEYKTLEEAKSKPREGQYLFVVTTMKLEAE